MKKIIHVRSYNIPGGPGWGDWEVGPGHNRMRSDILYLDGIPLK
jgi:hypothetical protein